MPVLASKATGIGRSPALIIVDAVLGFTSMDSPLGADFSDQIKVIDRLVQHAQKKGWPVIFSTVIYHSDDQASVFREKLPDLNILVPGSKWVKLDPRLSRGEQGILLEKQHASCFFGTDLDKMLRNAGVDSVLIGGFTTSGCVRATAVDALQYDYRVVVIEDASGDRDPVSHDANLKDLQLKYCDVSTTDFIISSY